MTGIALFERVAQAAESEAARRLADARARADEIRSKGSESRAAKCRAATDALRAELTAVHERACAEAGAQTAREILESRHRLLDRVRTAAETTLALLPDSPEHAACVESLLGDALSYVETGHRTVRCSRASQPLIAEVLRSLGCSDVAIDIDDTLSSGAIVQSDDSRVSIDATLVGQLRSRWPALSIAALADESSAAVGA